MLSSIAGFLLMNFYGKDSGKTNNALRSPFDIKVSEAPSNKIASIRIHLLV